MTRMVLFLIAAVLCNVIFHVTLFISTCEGKFKSAAWELMSSACACACVCACQYAGMGFEVQCSEYRATSDVVTPCMSKSIARRGVASPRGSRRSNVGKKSAHSRPERELFQFASWNVRSLNVSGLVETAFFTRQGKLNSKMWKAFPLAQRPEETQMQAVMALFQFSPFLLGWLSQIWQLYTRTRQGACVRVCVLSTCHTYPW